MSKSPRIDCDQKKEPAKPISRDEFAALFSSSYQKLWVIAVGLLHDRNSAEDMVQEAAFVALSKLNQFETGTNFTAWMSKIVRHLALNTVRKNKRQATIATDPAAINQNFASTNITIAEKVTKDKCDLQWIEFLTEENQSLFHDNVLQALTELEETARAALLLRTIEKLPYIEIAALLDIPQGTAMSHVHRAKQTLRRRLSSSHLPHCNEKKGENGS